MSFDLGRLLATGVNSSTGQWKARAVITTLGAYTGSGTGTLTVTATGALSAADGVTLALGDHVLLQAGLSNVTAVDSGPWKVGVLGVTGVNPVLVRPSWCLNGQVLEPGQRVFVGGEGTQFANSEWAATATTFTVGTTDGAWYPKTVNGTVVLAAGTHAAITTIPLTTGANIVYTRQATGGTLTNTVGYQTVPALTPGYAGTASFVPMAVVAAGTVQSSDTSTLQWTVHNF